MMVFLQHSISPSFKFLDTRIQPLLKTLTNGATGVSLFFVLSGFLITYLIITEIDETGKLNIKFFYIRRFLRIWPLYFAVILLSFALYPGFKELLGINNQLGSNIFYHLTFLSNFDSINIIKNCNGKDAMSQSITWSVSIEEQFYLFWPLIFLFPRKLWLYSIIGVIVFSIWFRVANNEDSVVLYFHTFSVLMDLAIGGLFAYLVKTNKQAHEFFEKAGTSAHIILFVSTFCVLHFGTVFLFGPYEASFGRVIPSLLFAFIIASQGLTTKQSFLCLGNFKFADKWGKMTYGIYMLHPIAITIIDVVFRLAGIDYESSFTAIIVPGLLMFAGTLMITWISYVYYEKVFLKMKGSFQKLKTRP